MMNNIASSLDNFNPSTSSDGRARVALRSRASGSYRIFEAEVIEIRVGLFFEN